MTTKVISFSLSPDSISKAVSELDDYINGIISKQKAFVNKLAEAGFETMKIRWLDTVYDGEHAEEFDVRISADGKGFELTADGNAVCFIEFGTGVFYNGSGSYPEPLPEGVAGIGQYGHRLGRLDSWRYRGEPGSGGVPDPEHEGYVITHGNPANMPMYYTVQYIKQNAVRIAREVFG